MDRQFVIEDWKNSSYEKFAKNFSYRNQWRVANILGDYEDCLSFCAMCYVICRKNYGETVNSPQQFMYMYRLWVEAEFNTMSTKESHNREMQRSLPKEEATINSEAELATRLLDATPELKSVLNLFLKAPQEIMQILREEAQSCHPKQFWKIALKACGINPSHSVKLAKELQRLLK